MVILTATVIVLGAVFDILAVGIAAPSIFLVRRNRESILRDSDEYVYETEAVTEDSFDVTGSRDLRLDDDFRESGSSISLIDIGHEGKEIPSQGFDASGESSSSGITISDGTDDAFSSGEEEESGHFSDEEERINLKHHSRH